MGVYLECLHLLISLLTPGNQTVDHNRFCCHCCPCCCGLEGWTLTAHSPTPTLSVPLHLGRLSRIFLLLSLPSFLFLHLPPRACERARGCGNWPRRGWHLIWHEAEWEAFPPSAPLPLALDFSLFHLRWKRVNNLLSLHSSGDWTPNGTSHIVWKDNDKGIPWKSNSNIF